MALQKPTYCGVDKIMAAYDSINGDCQYDYSVWHSQKDIAFQYVGNDALKARRYLEDNLTAMAESGNDNLLYLKFHPANRKKQGEFINYKTDVIANTPICCIENYQEKISGTPERSRVNDDGYNVYKMRLFMEELPTKLETMIEEKISSKIGALDDEEIDEPEIDPVQKYIGIISGLASNPQVMAVVGQILNFLKPAAPYAAPRINGMNENINGNADVIDNESLKQPGESIVDSPAEQVPVNEEILNEALGRLHQHCRIDTDLLLLADMADENPAQFQLLLGMLRKK